MTPPSPTPPWRTAMRERPLGAPREEAWAVLLDHLGPAPADLSVEPPWRHVRRLAVDGVGRVEQTVTLRDDGPTTHAAWSVGVGADRVLARLATAGEQLLDRLEAGTRG